MMITICKIALYFADKDPEIILELYLNYVYKITFLLNTNPIIYIVNIDFAIE